MPITNILLAFLLALGFLVFFLPVSVWTKKLLDLEVTQPIVALLVIGIAMGLLGVKAGGAGFVYLALAVFCLWAFTFGFLADRKYPYTLALVFLVACPFLLIAKLDQIAEFSAVLCYLCLVLGVLKDLFYDKLVD